MTQYLDSSEMACHQNPVLGPDAWNHVRNNHPVGDGARAALVCRFACRIRDRCPFGEENGVEAIAGKGWFGTSGRFIKPPDDLLEVTQAAAYIGLQLSYLNVLIKKQGIERRSIKGTGLTTFIRLTDVYRLADTHGPRHGTAERHTLHLLRGEVPCLWCKLTQKAETSHASVLRRGDQ